MVPLLFALETSRVHISTRRSCIVIEVILGFPWYLQECVGMVPEIRPWPLPHDHDYTIRRCVICASYSIVK